MKEYIITPETSLDQHIDHFLTVTKWHIQIEDKILPKLLLLVDNCGKKNPQAILKLPWEAAQYLHSKEDMLNLKDTLGQIADHLRQQRGADKKRIAILQVIGINNITVNYPEKGIKRNGIVVQKHFHDNIHFVVHEFTRDANGKATFLEPYALGPEAIEQVAVNIFPKNEALFTV